MSNVSGSSSSMELVKFVVIFAMVSGLFMFFWSSVGFGEIFEGPKEEVGLSDYSSVDSISTSEGGVTLLLSESSRFDNIGSTGDDMEITHISVSKPSESLAYREPVTEGQREFSYVSSSGVSGEYTVTLLSYRPADPGLFGSPERYYKQEVGFVVSGDGSVEVTDLPVEARY